MNNVVALDNESYRVNVRTNVSKSFSAKIKKPIIDPTPYTHPLAEVIGNVHLGKLVMVSPTSSVRGSESQSTWIGDDVNIQDCVIIRALETHIDGKLVRESVVRVNKDFYGVHIGEPVCLVRQC